MLEKIIFKLIIGTLLTVWLLLVLLGKGGFVHILLLTALGFGMLEVCIIYRNRMTER